MTFFDKKNEVINIELTPYGKHLLSKGKFKPVYYEFLDNDILYDSSYANIQEPRNNISERIKNETPRTKTQYVFTGVETKIKQLNRVKTKLFPNDPSKEDDLIENFQIFEKLHFNSSPIGNSDLDDTVPALNFAVYNSDILSASLFQNYNSHIINVPLIQLKDISFSSSVVQSQTSNQISTLNVEQNQFPLEENLINQNPTNQIINSAIFPDNTFISVEDKTVLMNFFENNLKQNAENFEIEIFTYETAADGSEMIKQLSFNNSSTNNIVNDPNKVEYYFSILTDNSIPEYDSRNILRIKDTVVFPTKK